MENATPEPVYAIPTSYRRMENLHIVFWLLKDVSWCMVWKTLGIAMIFPTLAIAAIIAWRTRHLKSELAHNLAIVLWISANSYWMVSEFFHFDEVLVGGLITGKHLALVPFTLGLLVLAYYYLFLKPREADTQPEQVATL
ncbi:hypothetical protein [Hymenobacter latericus]|uniref:hypothetical protein n=1 Tax=Hymenobacter sp. YIM 151858-1 TaxID=2987688 RepID=UPI00222664AD|nr:hypothetical protein [Hymenobacter sp. YIM 151858-1]UYZ60877.1 hypothetical protein OIS50_08755 [Hymenobacter sp. YIM 151858-1]